MPESQSLCRGHVCFDADLTGKTEVPTAVTLRTQWWEELGAAVSVWFCGAEKA